MFDIYWWLTGIFYDLLFDGKSWSDCFDKQTKDTTRSKHSVPNISNQEKYSTEPQKENF